MADRRGWDALSKSYRDRLSRKGITRASYERGGSLASARGHGKTPEHPLGAGERVPRRYQKWYNSRYNSPIKMLTDEGERWLVSVPPSDRKLIASHWNAVKAYLFNIPMRKARFWNGDTLTSLNFFTGKSVGGSELDDDGRIHAAGRHPFMTDLEAIADWTYSDVVSFTDIYKNMAVA